MKFQQVKNGITLETSEEMKINKPELKIIWSCGATAQKKNFLNE